MSRRLGVKNVQRLKLHTAVIYTIFFLTAALIDEDARAVLAEFFTDLKKEFLNNVD